MDTMDRDNKNMLLKLKKTIKLETNANQRLQSLKLPRDLALGGTKSQKRQFTPNVNVTRNKQNIKGIEKSNGVQQKDKSHLDRNKNGLRNKNCDKKYIESSGIFSEGAGNPINPKRYASDRFNDRDTDGAIAAMAVPTIQKNEFEVDKESEKDAFDLLVDDDDVKDNEKCPYKQVIWENYPSTEIKQEGKIKKEETPENQKTVHKIKKEDDYSLESPGYKQFMPDIKIKKEDPVELLTPSYKKLNLEPSDHFIPRYTVGEYLKEDHQVDEPSISLWSLPSSFAGKGLSDDPNCATIFDYGLNDMLEGKIGKLVIRKSGKVEVHIGRIKYKLEADEDEAYEEQVVTVETDKHQHAAILGPIENRYLLRPDWDNLIT